ncbi:hypothetical protein ONE63_003596 [Megalurothrips usitatus]|uniref:Uncharacterized protein n=1 Tax=Megalurothrips usitatus TaxID=439358 RepID=A0AAV7XAG0_9NEOP|nr:hypothetical protein ONE63_003596 [Megalurothrips usitatus]
MIRPVQFFATVCVLASALDVTTAVCCPNEVMKLQTEASNVERLLWADFRESGCADGRHVGSLDVCSVGPCNFFHCNCDGGCITGRQFDVPTIGEQPLSFYCDKDVPADLDKDVMNLIKHRDCTCSNAVHRDLRHTSGDYTLSVTEVEGPEQNASDPIYCEKGMVYCEVDIRRVKSFGVTTSLSFTLGAGAGLSQKDRDPRRLFRDAHDRVVRDDGHRDGLPLHGTGRRRHLAPHQAQVLQIDCRHCHSAAAEPPQLLRDPARLRAKDQRGRHHSRRQAVRLPEYR